MTDRDRDADRATTAPHAPDPGAGRDGERLDWLEGQEHVRFDCWCFLHADGSVVRPDTIWHVRATDGSGDDYLEVHAEGRGPTLRAAIDAAIAEWAARGGEKPDG